MHEALIQRYLAGADLPQRGLRGLTREQLTTFPIPGTWSIQQILWHLSDSDLIASDRMKRVIAEDNPLLVGYDQTRFSQRLPYHDLDPAIACELFRLNRLVTAETLRRLPAEAFQRTGVHNERGKLTLLDLVNMYVDHVQNHMKSVEQKRALLGNPLPA